jgi:transposase-like protein
MTSTKAGASALSVQRQLGLGRYETAWTWLHKLRRAMVRPDRERLVGPVEVDETYVGGVEEGLPGRGGNRKILVAIAVEKRGRGMGRLRVARVPDASAPSLTAFVKRSVEPRSEVITDGWHGYDSLGESGYHRRRLHQPTPRDAHRLLPRVHRVAALLKRWLLGTHQGATRRQHLDFYLDEFTFRFNRRSATDRGLLFHRLFEQAVAIAPVSWEGVASAVEPPHKG